MYLWKPYIDTEIIDMFLDRLFQETGCSFFDFERMLKDYGMSSIKVFPIKVSEDCDCTEDCLHLQELDEDVQYLKSKLKLKTKDSRRNRDLYVEEKKKFKRFKENAVIFSMDDGDF